ncbi:hypothetical protein C8R44DRAFT_746149 [Mycena epipterygia]|nr:hypothetical protein C8R44DRAFT_746149 [Mycena epipterygia]
MTARMSQILRASKYPIVMQAHQNMGNLVACARPDRFWLHDFETTRESREPRNTVLPLGLSPKGRKLCSAPPPVNERHFPSPQYPSCAFRLFARVHRNQAQARLISRPKTQKKLRPWISSSQCLQIRCIFLFAYYLLEQENTTTSSSPPMYLRARRSI